MRSRHVIFPTVTVLLALLMLVPAAVTMGQTFDPLELTGSLHGAHYKILVPENWNGTLLVYAHGYSSIPVENPDAAFLGEPTENLLLAQGYALAGSGFRGAGWTVEEGIKDTKRLTEFFKSNVGHPKRVILYGNSMGSVVVLKSAEKYLGLYDGTISMCSLGAGTTGNWDLKLDLALAYDVTFGWPESWGAVGDVRDDINFDTEVFPKVIGEFSNPSNYGYFEFIRLVNGLPMGGFYAPAGSLGPGMIVNAFLFTSGRAELEARAGGPVAQNVDHVYRLDGDEWSYLESLGVNVDGLLAAMNVQTNIEARRSARSYLERYADYRGHLHGPVLMLHNIQDPLAPVELTSAYVKTLAAVGKADLLVRAYTDRVGHCNFTPGQVGATVLAMEAWLETGTPPGAAFFPEALEFVDGYEPGPWPQPPQ